MIPQAYFQYYFNFHDTPGDSPYSRNNKKRKNTVSRIKSTTLSSIDCAYLNEFITSLNELCALMIDEVSKSKNELQAVAAAVAASQKFYCYDNLDLGDLLYYISHNTRNKKIQEASNKSKMLYKKLIIENKLTGDAKKDATGLAVYFPIETFDEAYLKTKFADTLWNELITLVLNSNPVFDPEQIDSLNL